MDQAKSGLIWYNVVKWRDVEICSKFCPSPVLWEPFKVLERLVDFQLPIREPILDVGSETSLRTWIKYFFFIPKFTIVNAPV